MTLSTHQADITLLPAKYLILLKTIPAEPSISAELWHVLMGKHNKENQDNKLLKKVVKKAVKQNYKRNAKNQPKPRGNNPLTPNTLVTHASQQRPNNRSAPQAPV